MSRVTCCVLVAASLPACSRGESRRAASTDSVSARPAIQATSPISPMHESYIQAGGVRVLPIENPMAGDARAIAHGKELFVRYNCSGCHGDDGAGNWAPALNDGRWRYGGTPGEIYQSIYEGRPMGMPAFGERVPASQLWELAAYLKSLETGAPIATQGAREWAGTGKSGKEQTQ